MGMIRNCKSADGYTPSAAAQKHSPDGIKTPLDLGQWTINRQFMESGGCHRTKIRPFPFLSRPILSKPLTMIAAKTLPARTARCLVLVLSLAACSAPSPVVSPAAPAVPATAAPPVAKIALALGGGAARGFAHIGVIKALEAQGIVPDFIVGTSAGSLVGALYAGGASGFDLQRTALAMDDAVMTDWSLFGRGLIKGEAMQEFVNAALANRPIEKLPRSLAIVSTDLQSGEPMVFRSGNAGMAVRASSSVPGIFQPARINGRDYVDGGLVAPVPVRIARSLGADIVIAVDISAQPREQKTSSSFEMLLQTFAIMGQSILAYELKQADVVVRPNIRRISGTDFQSKHLAILEGERAAQAQVAAIKAKLAAFSAQTANRQASR